MEHRTNVAELIERARARPNELAFCIGDAGAERGQVWTTLEETSALEVIGRQGTGRSTLVWAILVQLLAANDEGHLGVVFVGPRRGEVEQHFQQSPQVYGYERAWEELERRRQSSGGWHPFLLFVVDEVDNAPGHLGARWGLLREACTYNAGFIATGKARVIRGAATTLAFALSGEAAREFAGPDSPDRSLLAQMEHDPPGERCLYRGPLAPTALIAPPLFDFGGEIGGKGIVL